MKTPMLSLGKAGLALPVLTLMMACNSVIVPVDPLAAYKDQKLNWTSCDPTLIEVPAYLDPIKDRVQCADVRVPMDYKNPSKGDVSFAVLRVKAEVPAERKGAIFVNPGGPGGDGLIMGPVLAAMLRISHPSSQVGGLFKKVSQQYDLIGFSPRGTGSSSRLYCGTNEDSLQVAHPSDDRSAANTNAMLHNARLVAQACQKNPLTPYINTENTARDMDLVRHLLGDQKLNYLGYSYGTWLGAWYAKLFPKNAGNMVLDSNMALEDDLEAAFVNMVKGFDRSFREVVAPYTARHPDLFELGNTPQQVLQAYDALPRDIKYATVAVAGITGDLYSSQYLQYIPMKIKAAQGVAEILAQNPNPAEVHGLIEAHTFAKNPQTNTIARSIAHVLFDGLMAYYGPMPTETEVPASAAVFTAVVCNDTPFNRDPQYWVNLGNQLAQQAPLTGGAVTQQPCAFWKQPSTQKPATLNAQNMPPLLLLQAEFDAATPIYGALKAHQNIPNSRMVLVDDETSHGVFPYMNECVDLRVAQYLLSGTLPTDKLSICEAHPLPGENVVYPVGTEYKAGQKLGLQQNEGQFLQQTFQDPAQAAELKQKLREILQEQAIKPFPTFKR